MAKYLTMISGDKGGVGKSTLTNRITEYLINNDYDFVSVDSDQANHTLKRFYKENDNVITIDTSKTDNFDKIVDLFENHDIVVLDTRASSFDKFVDWINEVNLFEVFEMLDIQFNFISMVTQSKDTVSKLKEMMLELGDNDINWIVAKNYYLSDNFEIYNNSKIKKVLDQVDAVEIKIPKMKEKLNDMLEKKDMTLTEAINSDEFKLLDKQRYKNYRKEIFNEIEKVEGLITGYIGDSE